MGDRTYRSPRIDRAPRRGRSRTRSRSRSRDRDRDIPPPRSNRDDRGTTRRYSRSRSPLRSPVRTRRSRSGEGSRGKHDNYDRPNRNPPPRRSPPPHRRRSRSRSQDRELRRRSYSRSRSRSVSPDRRKRKRRRSRSLSGSGSESDDRERRKRKEKHRRRSRSRDRKERKKDKKKDKKKKIGAVTSQYGKYGTINESDMFEKTQEFRAWLVEERKINPETQSKESTRKEFLQFMEDYNTATLPHEKYYNMDAYERRMNALRHGELLPAGDELTYDVNADLKAHSSVHKRKAIERESYLSKDQLMELRKVQNERIEAGKMKLLGMDLPQNLGVRMDGTSFDD